MVLAAPAAVPPTVLREALSRDTPALRLASASVPVASVPMKLPWTALSVAEQREMEIPYRVLPETTFRAAGVVPPTVLREALSRDTPAPRLASASVPVASVPMKLPWTVLSVAEPPEMEIPY